MSVVILVVGIVLGLAIAYFSMSADPPQEHKFDKRKRKKKI